MCKALGLNPAQVHRLTIEYTAGALATVTAHLFIITDQEGEVVELVKRFQEVPTNEAG